MAVHAGTNIAQWRGRVARGEHALGALQAWRPSAARCPEVREAHVLPLDEEVSWVKKVHIADIAAEHADIC